MSAQPAWVFASAKRTPIDAGKNSPGPAAYTLPQSVGPQPDSRKERAGTPAFGTGSREQRESLFLGPGHNKGMFGKGSPGPAVNYHLNAAVGKQVREGQRERIPCARTAPHYPHTGSSFSIVAPLLTPASHHLSSHTQVASNLREAPAPSFSKSDRWATYNKELKSNSTPGPGQY